jgi:predicted metal-dependent phosphoesterase TrpH
MKVDLHLHTSERSFCAVATASQQLQAAVQAGLGAVAVTDHEQLVEPALRHEWHERFAPLLVLPGIEISLAEDILVIGVEDPQLETRIWDWPDLHGFVRERGGLLIVAHPFRYRPEIRLDLDVWPPDALEAWSVNLRPGHAGRIEGEARRLGIPVVASSDAHATAPIGRFYNELETETRSERSILEAIRAGRFRPVANRRG